MISALFSRLFILLLGTLYPAYSSYKAIRAKDNKEYITWMMYWVVFALFTSAETITDIFLSFWFPFYYELKIIVVLWLLSPATQGSSILYRKFVHPVLVQREQEIDDYLLRAKEESVKTVMELGTRGVQYASRIIMQTAIGGGGSLMSTLRRSYSVGDVSDGGSQQVIRRQAVAAVTLQPLEERTERPASRNRGRQAAAAAVNTTSHVASLQDVSDSEMSFEEFDEFDEIGEEPALQEILMRPPTKRAPRATTVTREVYFTEIDSFPRIKQETNEAERYIGEIRSPVSSGYSSTEVLAADETGTVTVTRRGTRAAASRPVTMVDGASNAASKNHGPDVSISFSYSFSLFRFAHLVAQVSSDICSKLYNRARSSYFSHCGSRRVTDLARLSRGELHLHPRISGKVREKRSFFFKLHSTCMECVSCVLQVVRLKKYLLIQMEN